MSKGHPCPPVPQWGLLLTALILAGGCRLCSMQGLIRLPYVSICPTDGKCLLWIGFFQLCAFFSFERGVGGRGELKSWMWFWWRWGSPNFLQAPQLAIFDTAKLEEAIWACILPICSWYAAWKLAYSDVSSVCILVFKSRRELSPPNSWELCL